jgi:hypothetical protein
VHDLLDAALGTEDRLAGGVLCGRPSLPTCGTPALRKYLLTTMSVASWLHEAGTCASCISKTVLPSELLMRLERVVHSMVP